MVRRASNSGRLRSGTSSATERVLNAVLTFGARPTTQRDIALLAEVAQASVTRVKQHVGVRGPLLTSSPVRFTAEAGLVLAISVDHETMRAGLLDANGVLFCLTTSSPQRDQLSLPQAELLRRVGRLAADVLGTALADPQLAGSNGTLPVFAATLAMSAPISRDHRIVGGAVSGEGWNEPPFVRLDDAVCATLGPRFSRGNTYVINASQAASLSVAFDRVRELELPRTSRDQAFRHQSTHLVLNVGAEVSNAIINVPSDPDQIFVSRFLGARVHGGDHSLAGQIGHTPISRSAVETMNERSRQVSGLLPMDPGAVCSCGQPSHLQGLIGMKALGERLGVASDNVPLAFQLERFLRPASEMDDRAAQMALTDSGALLGRALTGIVLALDPGALTVVGPLALPPLIEGLRQARNEWTNAFWAGSQVQLMVPDPIDAWVVPRGAGLAVMRQHRYRVFRALGEGDGTADLLPSLDIDVSYIRNLRADAWR
jgi:hypothetical protein